MCPHHTRDTAGQSYHAIGPRLASHCSILCCAAVAKSKANQPPATARRVNHPSLEKAVMGID